VWLAVSQGLREITKKLGSRVNRELAKRLKALGGRRDDLLCLRWCEVREGFELFTSRRVYSCKACAIHTGLLALPGINSRRERGDTHRSLPGWNPTARRPLWLPKAARAVSVSASARPFHGSRRTGHRSSRLSKSFTPRSVALRPLAGLVPV